LHHLIGPTAIKAPVYPYLLSIFIILFNSFSKVVIVIFQHLLILISAFLALKIGQELKRVKESELFFLIFIFYPSYIYYPNVIEVTNVFIFEISLFIYLAVKFYKLNDNKNLILLSVITGVIFLTQPIVVPIMSIVWIFLMRKNLRKIIIPLIIVLLMLFPWIIRNYIVFDKFIPFKSPFWLNVYSGYNEPKFGNNKYDIIEKRDKLKIDSLINAHVNDVEMEKYYKEVILKTINKEPILYLEKTLFQIYTYWWVPAHYLEDNRLEFILVRKIPVLLLNLLTIISFVYLFKLHPRLMSSILLVLIYFTLIYATTQTINIRYKLDIEWLQFIPISIYIGKFIRQYTIF